MHGEGVRLVVGLPRGGGAVFIVGVGVVVVHVLPGQDGGAGRAAHGCGRESVGEMRAALLHDASSFVHGLHGAWEKNGVGKREGGRFALRDEGERRFKGSGIELKGTQGEIKKDGGEKKE